MFALLISMFSFSLSMSISPGPVNFTVLSSAMNYGFKASFAFISGATIGFTALLIAVCFGLSQIFQSFPVLMDILTCAGVLLLIWMGYTIFRSTPEAVAVQQKNKIPSFSYGVLMQWLNPKAWIAAFAGASLFSVRQNPYDLVAFISIYFVVCYLSLSVWGVLGEKMAQFLSQSHRVKMINRVMGIILILIALDIGLNHFIA